MGLTRTRDLRDGKSVWTAYRVPSILGVKLRRSTRADVVVVGAGISGALVAQALAEAGLRPVIVDRRRAALLGSTAASTALLQFELDTPLSKLSRFIGRRKAGRVWVASRDAVNDLRTTACRLGIRAHMQTRPSLYLSGNVLDAKGLQREAAARQRLGLASEWLNRKALRRHFDIDRPGALLSHGNAEANPIELAAGFMRHALKAGAKFYAPHEVVELQPTRRGTILLMDDGIEIHTARVVLCTGYEIAKIVPPSGNRIRSTWAIATPPQPQRLWPQRALIWEASDPYLYVRTTHDGRVICGGEDADIADATRRDARSAMKSSRIGAKLGRLFPALDTRAVFAWAGSFAASPSGMPTIGEIPGYSGCFAVMGYGGNGITFSMLARRLICAAILRRKSPDAALFGFD